MSGLQGLKNTSYNKLKKTGLFKENSEVLCVIMMHKYNHFFVNFSIYFCDKW